MKNLVLLSVLSATMLACTQHQPPVESASTGNDTKMLYETNLAVLKAAIKAFENEDIEGWASSVADSAVYVPGAYGSSPGKKEDWKKTLTFYVTDFDSIRLTNALFLPGIDSATHVPDGSVRYYGQWTSVHKSGVKTRVNFYSVNEFNTDHKVIYAADFFDVGGLINAVTPKSK